VNRDEDPGQQDDRVTGLEELRQEREIEERRFRVEDVVEEALYELVRPERGGRSPIPRSAGSRAVRRAARKLKNPSTTR